MSTPTIRIIHTADNHIGKKFSSYAPHHREKLVAERFNALKRVVEAGNIRNAHILIIAGDLFDSHTVRMLDIDKTVDILNAFAGEAVLVLPGNHDYYESSSEGLWARFIAKAINGRILLLKDQTPVPVAIGERQVIFYPGPCKSRHSDSHVIGWVNEIEKNPDDLHIGIAHGTVVGKGFPGENYFNMRPDDLASAGVDLWLLGHIHVPYPEVAQISNPGFLYAATHSPDGFDCQHKGCCWYLELDQHKQLRMEQIFTGLYQFHRLYPTLNGSIDISQLVLKLQKLPAENSFVEAFPQGQLTQDDYKQLQALLDQMVENFIFFKYDLNDVSLTIDQDYIDDHYTQGTLPHELMDTLSNRVKNPLALQLAHQLINSMSNLKSR